MIPTPAVWLTFVAIIIMANLPGMARSAFVSPQVRPIVRDTTAGEVKETRSRPSGVEQKPIGSTKSSRPAYSVLIVMTEPEEADVSINGGPIQKSPNGIFKTELPSGKRYKIVVSAGPDYEPVTRIVTLKRRGYEIAKALLPAKYGVVKIFPAIEGAKILVDGEPARPDTLEASKDSGFTLRRLTPGDHKFTYDLPGFVLYERNFKITPGSEYAWSLVPERAVTELTVTTDSKVAVYLDGKWVGTTPGDGKLKYIAELGPHELKLVKDDFEEFKAKYQFEYGQPVRVEQKLVPRPTSAEFSDDFDVPNQDRWTMPASGMRFKSRRLELENARTVGFPTNIRYRDFEMNFHLQLTNAGGAAWAVRVKDASNYYLFYLSGPEGIFPNRLVTYVVQNNQFDPNKPERTDNLLARLVAGGQYDIHIKATGSRIEHEITPAATGKTEQLGFYDDPNSTFGYGGIGFRTISIEKFSVDELVVRPR